MRKASIALGVALFLAYGWASVAYQNMIPLPDYRMVELDVRNGMDRDAWEKSDQARFQRLTRLEEEKYQLPEANGAGEGDYASSDRPLAAADFELFAARAPAVGPALIRLRDASAFHRFLARGYSLRDDIENPENPYGPPLYPGGRRLDKKMLDDLRRRGMERIAVVGHGDPVGFLPGTAIMVAVIFLTLVAVLKPILWDPFQALLEKRLREIEAGEEMGRQNQAEAARFEDERRRRQADLHRDIQEIRLKGQREAAKRAGDIVRAAREGGKEAQCAGADELNAAFLDSERELESRIAEFAAAIADAAAPRRGYDPGGRE